MVDHLEHRRGFLKSATATTAIATAASHPLLATTPQKKIRVGLIGCGNVSATYLTDLRSCPHVELVSVCDIKPERAQQRGTQFNVSHRYSHIHEMLAGEPFDLLVNTTDMQQHESLNRIALEAGKNVWSEKPIANSLSAGQGLLQVASQKGVGLWGAPAMVNSPQFEFMARAVVDGRVGRPVAAHAYYGHLGPDWSAFFYETGGGSLPDLGVYNLTTLTGILGPAKSVSAMLSIVTPTRTVKDKGQITVQAEDNASLLMDHGGGCISHVQCGFNYFEPHGHEGTGKTRSTLDIIGTGGAMHLIGYDWKPHGVDMATLQQPKLQRHCTQSQGFTWQQGASHIATCLATGATSRITPEHALHVVEIMTAARQSQETGRTIPLTSSFAWPLFKSEET